MNIFKKFLLGFLAFFISATSIFAAPVMAQSSPWYAPSLSDFTNKVFEPNDNEIFGERYTQAQIYWIMYSIVTFLVGPDLLNCVTSESVGDFNSCVNDLIGDSLTFNNNGSDPGAILSLAIFSDSVMNTKPASGVDYVASKLERLGVSEAYAQSSGGFGFQTLNPVSGLWSAMRNAAYSLMVIVIIVLGFMIMLRTKISPQASLTIQVALPRIVIALVLITFSFAIAGFLIDLTYLALGLISAILSFSGMTNLQAGPMFTEVQGWGDGMLSIGIMLIFYLFFVPVLGAAAGFAGVQFTLPIIGTGIAGAGVGLIAGIVVILLVLIVYIIAVVKILWLTLRTMLMITLMIVFSPLFILWGVLSSSSGFGMWIRSFIGHLSVFVTVPLVIMFANVIMWGSVGGNSFLADPATFGAVLNPYQVDTTLLAGGVELPGFFGGYNAIIGIAGAVILSLSAPTLANSIREFITTGRTKWGLASPEEALGPLYGAGMFGLGVATSAGKTILTDQIVSRARSNRSSSSARRSGGMTTGAIQNQNNTPTPLPYED